MYNEKEFAGINFFTGKKYKAALEYLSGSSSGKISVSKAEADEISKRGILELIQAYSFNQEGNKAMAKKHFSAYTTLVSDYFFYRSTKPYLLDDDSIYDTIFQEELYATGQDILIVKEWLHFVNTDKVYKTELYRQAIANELKQWGEFYGILFKNEPFVPLNNDIELSASKQKQAFTIAMDYFDQALTFNDNRGEVYFARAEQTAKKSRPKAIENYFLALEKNPDHAGALLALHKIYSDNEDNDEFIEFTSRFLMVADQRDKLFVKAPDFMNYFRSGGFEVQYCHERLAQTYFEKGNHLLYRERKLDEAADCLEACITLLPKLGSKYDYFEEPWISLTDVYQFKGDFKKALVCANKALKIYNHSVRGWSVKGAVLSNLRRYKEALNSFEMAIENNKEQIKELNAEEYFYPYYGKASVLALTNGDKTEIFKLIKKALALNPGLKSSILLEDDFKAFHSDKRFMKLVE